MKRYYRALPNSIVAPTENRYVARIYEPFDWVDDINEATKDYEQSAKVTRNKLKEEQNIDVELLQVGDDKLMTPRYVLARDVDEERLKVQEIDPGEGVTVRTDEVLTNRNAGDTTFEGVHEKLRREDVEAEDDDRK